MAKVVYKDYSRSAQQAMDRALKAGLIDCAVDLAKDIKKSISRPYGTGKEYIITRPEYGLYRRYHRASGDNEEPPVVLTGALRDSIGFRVEKSVGVNTVIQIGVLHDMESPEGMEILATMAHEPYPPNHDSMIPHWLEFGTSRAKARPFIGPIMNLAMTQGSLFRSKLRNRMLELSIGKY